MVAELQAPFAQGGSYPVDEVVASQILALALSRGGDYADLFFEFGVSGSYLFEDELLKRSSRGGTLGLGVRVIKGDATGYAYVEELSEAAMRRAALTAAAVADTNSRTPKAFMASALPSRYRPDASAFLAEGELKRDLLARADRAARAGDPRVTRVEASFSEEYREILVANSEGMFARDKQPLIRFGVRVLVEDGAKRQAGSSGGGGRLGLEYFEQVSPEDHAQQAVEQALVMLDAREAPAGELPVVLGPGDSGILLHEAVGHGLEADFNKRKTSNYSGCLGQSVASALCTVVDDPTIDESRGSINVDDEGSAGDATTLIEGGKLVGYIHDWQSARHFGVNVHGHGRRESFRSHPMPRMTNTHLLAGEDDPDSIIRSVSRGIYAKRYGGGQVDITNGDFVFSLTEGYLIEDGKITAPVKGVNLIGNGPEVMRRVGMLGCDFQRSDGVWTCGKNGQSVPVGVGCPTVKIESMTVGGTLVTEGQAAT